MTKDLALSCRVRQFIWNLSSRMSLKSYIVTLIAFGTIFLLVECKPSTLDVGNACMGLYLKDKKLIPEEFPIPPVLQDEERCKVIMAVILKSLEKALCVKITEKKSVKAECVMDWLQKQNVLDYLLNHEFITMSRALPEEEAQEYLEDIKENLRTAFETAARECDSDPTYGGVFDDVLEIRNESLAVLRQNYCFTKFVIETKLIDVRNVDLNPKKISTSNINCQEMIKANRIERQTRMVDNLAVHNLSEDQIQCVKDKYQIERAFDSNLALEVITNLDVSLEEKRTNKEKLALRLESFIKSMFVCFGNSSKGVPSHQFIF